MYSKTVNVAEIMRKIKADAISKRKFESDDTTEHLNKQIGIIYKEIDRVQDFIYNTRIVASQYLEMGMRIPTFPERPKIFRRVLILFTRFIRKATLFMTREQTLVNRYMDDCLKALSENVKNLTDLIINLENEMITAKQGQEYTRSLLEDLKLQFEKRFILDKDVLNEIEYVEFENKFRGSTEQIYKRLHYYLDNYLLNKMRLDSLILDLGCGRGEWLSLLQENGYRPKGIDINEKMVQFCQLNDLQAICCDCIEYLSEEQENSYDLITGFQLIEHMSLSRTSVLLEQSFRVLKPGGMIIFETPNCRNLEVGSYNFYSDPTHLQPLHKEFLEFLAQQKGYSQIESAYWKQEEIDNWWNIITGNDTTNVLDSDTIRTLGETIRSNFYIAPDYALIAVK